MIVNFLDDEAAKIKSRQLSRKLPVDIQRTALRKLGMLEAASSLNDLKIPPANRLEKLSKNRIGQYSIRINEKWRICFRWKDGNAYDVEIVDYH